MKIRIDIPNFHDNIFAWLKDLNIMSNLQKQLGDHP